MKQGKTGKQPEKSEKPAIVTRGHYIDFAPRKKHVKPTPRPQPRPQPKPQPKPQPTPPVQVVHEELTVASIVTTAPESTPAPEAPDANRYSLGGKSPFLESVVVEKRPLSSSVPEGYHEHVPRKNVYTRQQQIVRPASQPTPTSIVRNEPKKSNIPLILLIIATIIVGIAAGVGAYFLVFQAQ